jgi:hypothetical protein
MTERFGALPVPALPAPAGRESITDPLLHFTLDYFRTALNVHAAAAWRAVAPGHPPVRTAWAHDPDEVCFNERELPALYLWRGEGGHVEQLADDWAIKRSTLTLLWVFPNAPQAPQRRRAPFINGLLSLIHVIVERGRDPAWRVPADPDLSASDYGSVWPRWAGVFSFEIAKWKAAKLIIEADAARRAYDSLELEIDLGEHLVEDALGRFGPGADARMIFTGVEALPLHPVEPS